MRIEGGGVPSRWCSYSWLGPAQAALLVSQAVWRMLKAVSRAPAAACSRCAASFPGRGRDVRFAASSRGPSYGGACGPARAASAPTPQPTAAAPPPQAGCSINTLAQQAVTTPFVPASPVQGQVSYKDPTRTAAWQPDMLSRQHPQAARHRLSHTTALSCCFCPHGRWTTILRRWPGRLSRRDSPDLFLDCSKTVC